MEKPCSNQGFEDIEGASMVVSSSMSERLFEGDLHEGKGTESCILTVGAKLVAI